MHPRKQTIATLLLAVFAAGGLLSPLAHRISHVHSLEHSHGQAAAHFSSAPSPSGQFVVEERTPPHELTCDLCARLTLISFFSSENDSHRLDLTSIVRLGDALASGPSITLSRIRAPPVLS